MVEICITRQPFLFRIDFFPPIPVQPECSVCWLLMQAVDGNTRSGVECSVEGKQRFVSSCLLITVVLQKSVSSLFGFLFTSGKDVIHPEEGRTTQTMSSKTLMEKFQRTKLDVQMKRLKQKGFVNVFAFDIK